MDAEMICWSTNHILMRCWTTSFGRTLINLSTSGELPVEHERANTVYYLLKAEYNITSKSTQDQNAKL